jgi:proline iminopeptidase
MSRTLLLLPVLAGAMACASAPAPPESAPRSGFITTSDGVDLHYTILGAGADTVVMPLGSWWRPHVAPLAEGRTLILYDPRDRGRSDPMPDSTRLGLEYEINDLETVRRFFALERLNLIGWSYLGGVSALYAAIHPNRVNRLVLHAPVPPRFHPHVGGALADMASRADTVLDRLVAEAKRAGLPASGPIRYCELHWRASVARQVGSPEALDRVMSAGFCDLPNEWPDNFGFRHVLRSMGEWDWRKQVAAFTGPVLIVHGAQDNMPLEGSREWVEAFPDASLLLVEEAGHFPLIEGEPDVAAAIDRFLGGDVLFTVEDAGHGIRILRKGGDGRWRDISNSNVAPAPGGEP